MFNSSKFDPKYRSNLQQIIGPHALLISYWILEWEKKQQTFSGRISKSSKLVFEECRILKLILGWQNLGVDHNP